MKIMVVDDEQDMKLLFEQRNKKGLNLQQTYNKGLRDLKFFCLLIHLKLKSSFFF